MRSRGLALGLVLLAACGDDSKATIDGSIDGPVDSSIDANPMPPSLADTGLCANAECTQFMPDVIEYAPQYQLYSDGATKRRWISLPPGTTINTSNMDHWIFPVGTKLWKEFTRDGIRVETRFITKLIADDTAPMAWSYVSYQWNTTQDATTLVPPSSGAQNANGTNHDIPSRAQCRRCHEGVPGRVLGFNAMSLDYAAPAGVMDLDDAIAANLLSAAPPGAASPHYPLPGTAVDQAAFGYLHGNCGGCHNPTSPTHDTVPLDLRLDTTKLATVGVVPAYVTSVDVNGTVSAGGTGNQLLGKIVKPGDPDNSVMIIRMTATTSPPRMPEIGIETVDPDGQTAVRAWISQPP